MAAEPTISATLPEEDFSCDDARLPEADEEYAPLCRDNCRLSDDAVVGTEEPIGFKQRYQRKQGFGRVPMLLAVGLGLVAFGGAISYWSKGSVQHTPSALQSPSKIPYERFLTSDELARTVVEHAIRFHNDAEEGFVGDLSEAELQMLKDQATTQSLTLAKKIGENNVDAGRKLSDLKLTDEHWKHTHRLLDALHDTRIQDLGQYVAHAVRESAGDQHSVRNKLDERHEELRHLASEVVPESLRHMPLPGRAHWEMAVDAEGKLEAHGPLGAWDVDVELDKRRLEGAEGCTIPDNWHEGSEAEKTSLLQDYSACLKGQCADQSGTTIFGPNRSDCMMVLGSFNMHCQGTFKHGIAVEDVCPVACGKCSTGPNKARILWITIASSVAAIFSIVTLVLTASLGPAAAAIMFIVQTSLGSALCGTTLGIAFIPALKHVSSWVPCMIMTAFTGLESIWTFRKALL